MALMDISAAARRASSLRSQCTYDPNPGGRPTAITSKTPPSVSPRSPAASIAAFISSSASGSTQRTAGGGAPGDPPPARRPPADAAPADFGDVAEDGHSERGQERATDGTDGHARGGLAGAAAFQHPPHVAEAVLLRAHPVGG